uniref:FZ domain-containing protein n=2 Tax=Palpitomonas bilix TaxID=652834 RepID=A0A7S3LWJ7_9EUKA|mmetsp:Transcript_5639/g.13150  ORF Transcript_5639/g.13150 Transcript_5639/m.13150 type:complete len:660 (+) Transcript_5639:411-2390(+)
MSEEETKAEFSRSLPPPVQVGRKGGDSAKEEEEQSGEGKDRRKSEGGSSKTLLSLNPTLSPPADSEKGREGDREGGRVADRDRFGDSPMFSTPSPAAPPPFPTTSKEGGEKGNEEKEGEGKKGGEGEEGREGRKVREESEVEVISIDGSEVVGSRSSGKIAGVASGSARGGRGVQRMESGGKLNRTRSGASLPPLADSTQVGSSGGMRKAGENARGTEEKEVESSKLPPSTSHKEGSPPTTAASTPTTTIAHTPIAEGGGGGGAGGGGSGSGSGRAGGNKREGSFSSSTSTGAARVVRRGIGKVGSEKDVRSENGEEVEKKEEEMKEEEEKEKEKRVVLKTPKSSKVEVWTEKVAEVSEVVEEEKQAEKRERRGGKGDGKEEEEEDESDDDDDDDEEEEEEKKKKTKKATSIFAAALQQGGGGREGEGPSRTPISKVEALQQKSLNEEKRRGLALARWKKAKRVVSTVSRLWVLTDTRRGRTVFSLAMGVVFTVVVSALFFIGLSMDSTDVFFTACCHRPSIVIGSVPSAANVTNANCPCLDVVTWKTMSACSLPGTCARANADHARALRQFDSNLAANPSLALDRASCSNALWQGLCRYHLPPCMNDKVAKTGVCTSACSSVETACGFGLRSVTVVNKCRGGATLTDTACDECTENSC